MAGHVPKYGAQNAGNFTEMFTLARTGGKAGSGDSAASQEDAPLRNPRAAPGGRGGGGGAGGAPPRRPGSGTGSAAGSGSGGYEKDRDHSDPGRRSSGAHERDSSTRSSQEGGTRPLPTARDGAGRGGRGARRPRNVNEEFAGASHLPKFGDWNNSDSGEPNYTVMFQAASKERQTGSAGDLGSKSNKSSGDHSRSSNGGAPKKQSSSWWCFS